MENSPDFSHDPSYSDLPAEEQSSPTQASQNQAQPPSSSNPAPDVIENPFASRKSTQPESEAGDSDVDNEDEQSPAQQSATQPFPISQFREETLGEKTEGSFKTTYHVYKNGDLVCYYLDRIYDLEGRMVRMVKKSSDGRSETRFDPDTGDIERIFESYTLPDGNHLSKEKRYLDYENTTESVLVVCPGGGLVRAVVREAVGLVNVFQGQTEFAREGHATVTVNHWFDLKTSKLTMREQIQWLSGGERGVTEHFYFGDDGGLINYRKVLYHPGSDRFLEEVHIYEAHSQKLRVKEVRSFERNSAMADMEVTIFDANGAIVEQGKSKVSRVQQAAQQAARMS